MTHAMVITAVHVDDKGKAVRYKVENSWSEASGQKGVSLEFLWGLYNEN
jgi:bleomycin hydrolase